MHEEHLGSEMPSRGDLSCGQSLYFKVPICLHFGERPFGLDSVGTGPIGPRSKVHMMNQCAKR